MEAENIFRKHCERSTKSLFKGFLMMLEDLNEEHRIILQIKAKFA